MTPHQNPIHVGIIGTGFGQRVHLPAFRADSHCQVVAICSSSQEHAAEVAQQQGIASAYGDWHELLENPTLDAVSIAVPPSLQAQMARAALHHGKAVFCEKPLATSMNEALELVNVAQDTGLPTMLDFEFPELPVWQHTKALLDQGAVGHVEQVNITWAIDYQPNRGWKASSSAGGGVLNLFGCHCLYYSEWLFGKIAYLSSTPGNLGDTFCQLSLALEMGGLISIAINSNRSAGNRHRVEIRGSDGVILLDNSSADYLRGFRLSYRSGQSNNFKAIELLEDTTYSDGRIGPVARLVARFITWVATGQPAHPDFKEGLRVQSLMEKIMVGQTLFSQPRNNC